MLEISWARAVLLDVAQQPGIAAAAADLAGDDDRREHEADRGQGRQGGGQRPALLPGDRFGAAHVSAMASSVTMPASLSASRIGSRAPGRDNLPEPYCAYATGDERSANEPKRPPARPRRAPRGRRRPENPPCPACGEPLFGWIDLRPGLRGPVSRCESCGLGVVGEPGGAAERRSPRSTVMRRERRRGSPTGPASPPGSAAPAGPAWSRAASYLFTVEAVRRLVANRDQVVASARWSPGAGIATMWQTILNGFTFGRNVALGALGRGTAGPRRAALAAPPRRADQRRRRDPGPARGACRWS